MIMNFTRRHEGTKKGAQVFQPVKFDIIDIIDTIDGTDKNVCAPLTFVSSNKTFLLSF